MNPLFAHLTALLAIDDLCQAGGGRRDASPSRASGCGWQPTIHMSYVYAGAVYSPTRFIQADILVPDGTACAGARNSTANHRQPVLGYLLSLNASKDTVQPGRARAGGEQSTSRESVAVAVVHGRARPLDHLRCILLHAHPELRWSPNHDYNRTTGRIFDYRRETH